MNENNFVYLWISKKMKEIRRYQWWHYGVSSDVRHAWLVNLNSGLRPKLSGLVSAKDWSKKWNDPLSVCDSTEKYPIINICEYVIIIISTTMFMVLSSWQSHCKSLPGSFDECRMAPSGRRPKTKPDDLGCESCQKLHPPSPFIITPAESWYSFYCPTEGRWLSRPSWLVTYRDGLPVHRRSPIRVLTGFDVAQLRWSKPTRYH